MHTHITTSQDDMQMRIWQFNKIINLVPQTWATDLGATCATWLLHPKSENSISILLFYLGHNVV